MLRELHTSLIETELHNTFDDIINTSERIMLVCEDVNVPDVPDGLLNNLLHIMDDAEKRYGAAKKGLSLVSKLKPGPERKKHFSRILGNMNKLRAYNERINKSLAKVSLTKTSNE